MVVITIVLGVPIAASSRFPAFHRVVQMTAGFASIAFGAFLMYHIGIGEGLLAAGR